MCFDAFALSLVPSSATWPSFTSPAAWHNLRIRKNSPARASRWRRRNSLMHEWSGLRVTRDHPERDVPWQRFSIFATTAPRRCTRRATALPSSSGGAAGSLAALARSDSRLAPAPARRPRRGRTLPGAPPVTSPAAKVGKEDSGQAPTGGTSCSRPQKITNSPPASIACGAIAGP
jgi:hypothetical protein